MFAPLLMTIAFCGCTTTDPGPASVRETSTARRGLPVRIEFVEKYVTFRRQYEKLDYDIFYQNNGGGLFPAPSDWDIRLLAVVPRIEIDAWIPENAEQKERPSQDWLKDLPGSIERDGISEWYRVGGIEVGIDRERSVIAYRNTSTPD